MLNGLNPDQDRQNVGPDLGPNCLHRLSADFCFVLFDSLRSQSTIFQFCRDWFSSTKQQIKCLALGHSTVTRPQRGLNQQPFDPESNALPTEPKPIATCIYQQMKKSPDSLLARKE